MLNYLLKFNRSNTKELKEWNIELQRTYLSHYYNMKKATSKGHSSKSVLRR